MLGTYASLALCLGASVLVGRAMLVACGWRGHALWIAPAVGHAALCPIAWWTVRLPGEGSTAAIALGLAALGSAVYLRGPGRGEWNGLATAVAVAVAAVVAG